MTNTDALAGDAALAAFNRASALVKQGKYDEALAVDMRSSDRTVIERRIEKAQKR